MRIKSGGRTFEKNHTEQVGLSQAFALQTIPIFLKECGKDGATLKEIAHHLYDGDYIKAQNDMRYLRQAGLVIKNERQGPYYLVKKATKRTR